jgi:hypothetical protein
VFVVDLEKTLFCVCFCEPMDTQRGRSAFRYVNGEVGMSASIPSVPIPSSLDLREELGLCEPAELRQYLF